MENKLNISIVLDSLEVLAWQYALLEKLQQSPYVESVLPVLSNSTHSRQTQNSLWNEHRKLDGKLFRPTPNAFYIKNIQSLFPNKEIGSVETVLKKTPTDIIVWLCEQAPPSQLYAKARYGIWFYVHGQPDFPTTSNALIGYSAFFQKKETATSALLIKQEVDDFPKIAYQSWSMPHAYSLANTQNEQAWKILSFIPRTLKHLFLAGKQNFFKNLETSTPIKGNDFFNQINNPSLFQSIFNIGKHLCFIFQRKFNSFFFHRQWILLYGLNKNPTRSFTNFIKLLPPKDKFWADPFLWDRADTHYLFFEELPFATQKGHISFIKIKENGEVSPPETILDFPYHLSYPFIFEFESKLYMIPESFFEKNIQLYECIDFPKNWRHKMNLMSDVTAVDTTLFYYQDTWWLFTNMVENEGASLDDELYLFYAASPITTNWTPHPQNPIISDVQRARPAGNLFWEDGKLIRPSQDCSRVYGYGFNFNEIEIMTKTEYQEKCLHNFRPDWDKQLKRTHTFNHQKGITVIDAMIHKGKFW